MREVFELLNTASSVALSALLNTFWLALAVTLLAWATMRFALPISAAVRHRIWWGVLAIVVALPAMHVLRDTPRPSTTMVTAVAVRSSIVTPEPPRAATIMQARYTPPPPSRFPVAVRAGYWPLAIFAIGALALLLQLGRVLWSYRYLRAVKRQSVRASREVQINFDEWVLGCCVERPVRLLLSDEIASPMAVGFHDPAVILPPAVLTELSDRDVDHVLLHELAHLARRDDWTNLFARIAAGALAINPIALWILRMIHREREIACDDWVVEATGAARPYAASLLHLCELRLSHRRALLATGMADSGPRIRERIERLIHDSREISPQRPLLRLLLSLAGLVALVAAGMLAPRWVAFAQGPARAPVPSPSVEAADPSPAPRALPSPRPRRPLSSRVAVAAPVALPVQAPAATPQPVVAPAPSRNGSFLAALVAAGYRDLPVDEIIELKNQGVNADYILGMSQAGWGKLTSRQLIDLKAHGVSPEYARQLREAGLQDLDLKNIVDARNNGVRAEYVQEIHSLGFGPYTLKQVIEFRVHGVRPEMFRAFKESGYTRPEPREIIEAQIHGLRAEHLRAAKEYGPNLTLKQIIRLKQAGVL
jgi:bla regulator protein blaR1